MVFSDIRLRERRINQIIRCCILSLQKTLRCKLVVRLQLINLGILQLNAFNVFRELCLIVVPENQFSGITRKFGIQSIYYLF